MNSIGERATQTKGEVLLTATLDGFASGYTLRASPPEVRRVVSSIRRFLWRQGINRAEELTPLAVQEHLAGLRVKGLSARTIRNHKGAVSVFCQHLRIMGLLAGNPCREVPNPRKEFLPPLWLEPAEVAKALRLARKHGCWPEVALALATGMRVAEVARLEWADVNLRKRTLIVRRSKSGRFRVIPLADLAIKALREQHRQSKDFGMVFPARRTCRGKAWLIDAPRCSRVWQRMIQPIRAASGKFRASPGRRTGHGWHLLRHTAASHWVQAGVSIYKVAAWLGHSSVSTTQLYAHLAQAYDPEVERGIGREA